MGCQITQVVPGGTWATTCVAEISLTSPRLCIRADRTLVPNLLDCLVLTDQQSRGSPRSWWTSNSFKSPNHATRGSSDDQVRSCTQMMTSSQSVLTPKWTRLLSAWLA